MNLPDLDTMMSYWVSLLGLDQPDPYSGKPWTITWGWVDSIPHPDGGDAVGLNQGNGATQEAHISIRRPRSLAELVDLEDTACHEVNHCIGIRMEALFEEGRDVDAHEYLACTIAPAMVKIKGTPKAKYLAKAARTLPARAKGKPMDAMKLLLALCQGLMGLANLPEEAKALIQPVLDEANKGTGGDAAPSPVSDPPSAAKPPEAAPAKPEDATPSNDAGMRDDEMAKRFKKETDAGIAVLLEARPDISDAQREYIKTECKSIAGAAAYLKTIPLAKPQEVAKPLEQLGNGSAPRGGAGNANAPGTDAKINALFRILPDNPDDDGVKFGDGKTDGKLVTFSVTGAFAKIKRSTAKMVEEQKARMIRGAA